MKPIRFLGDSLTHLREFDADAKQDAGYQLDKVQRGEQPDDFKPMHSKRKLKPQQSVTLILQKHVLLN